MNELLILLCAYSVCFGLQHKVPFLHRVAFLTKMLSCTYCTGFHAGYLTYFIFKICEYIQNGSLAIECSEVFVYSFASAIFCYVVDVVVQYFEK